LTAGPKRKRNPAIVKFIAAWLRKKFGGRGVDCLAARPFAFAQMSLQLAVQVERLDDAGEVALVAKALADIQANHPHVVSMINAGCRDAMSLRKEGKLRGGRR